MWLPVARARLGDPHLLRFAKLCVYLWETLYSFDGVIDSWKKQISVRSASSVFDINYVVARVRLGDPHLLRFLLIWNLWEAFLLEGCVSEIRAYYDSVSSMQSVGPSRLGARLGDTRLLGGIILLRFYVKMWQIESGVESPRKLPSFSQKVAYFLGEIKPFSRWKL